MCAVVREGLGADAVAVALLTHLPQRQLLCASGELGAEFGVLQFAVGEGPCFTAAGHAVTVVWSDVRQPQSVWPVFGPLLDERLPEIGAVQAVPLMAQGQSVGSMDVIYRRAQPRHGIGVEQAEVAAEAVTEALLERGRALLQETEPGAPGGWEPVEVIDARWGGTHQASGMLAERRNISTEEALSLLRARWTASGQPLPELSAAVLAGADL
ncbi:GAF and ANTAR domain-containing protein [Streptomyces sp. NPDC016845]|uniref:GAF and ANTAR domain-containing protein n=1 Tax=Streptomyces sp. NPDC016845 TaxID=3364972 RepID=UPI0037964260